VTTAWRHSVKGEVPRAVFGRMPGRWLARLPVVSKTCAVTPSCDTDANRASTDSIGAVSA
jgi:hypothetical protein